MRHQRRRKKLRQSCCALSLVIAVAEQNAVGWSSLTAVSQAATAKSYLAGTSLNATCSCVYPKHDAIVILQIEASFSSPALTPGTRIVYLHDHSASCTPLLRALVASSPSHLSGGRLIHSSIRGVRIMLSTPIYAMGEEQIPSGTGNKLARAVIIVAGVAALIAVLISFLSIWLQLKST